MWDESEYFEIEILYIRRKAMWDESEYFEIEILYIRRKALSFSY